MCKEGGGWEKIRKSSSACAQRGTKKKKSKRRSMWFVGRYEKESNFWANKTKKRAVPPPLHRYDGDHTWIRVVESNPCFRADLHIFLACLLPFFIRFYSYFCLWARSPLHKYLLKFYLINNQNPHKITTPIAFFLLFSI